MMLALMLMCIVGAWLFVVLLILCLARLAAQPAPAPVRHATPPLSVAPQPRPDPDEVRQIMHQLGRGDAAGRAMAERILAASGPRQPL